MGAFLTSSENGMRSVRHSRKPDPLRRNRFSFCRRFSLRVYDHADASKNPPRLTDPDTLKDEERILRHEARQLVAMDQNLKLSVLFRG